MEQKSERGVYHIERQNKGVGVRRARELKESRQIKENQKRIIEDKWQEIHMGIWSKILVFGRSAAKSSRTWRLEQKIGLLRIGPG
jgi:hypothetical protein